MAKKGEVARQYVTDTICKAFGANLEGVQDKKIYVWADDGGEKLQFAITVTMPKTMVTCGGAVSGGQSASSCAFDTETPASPAPAAAPVEMSAADKAKVAELMKQLGID